MGIRPGSRLKLRTQGSAVGVSTYALGTVTRVAVADPERRRTQVLVARTALPDELDGYAGAVLEDSVSGTPVRFTRTPTIRGIRDTTHLAEGDVVLLSPTGQVRTMFRPGSPNNVIFMTERCNSYCIMCSQPPRADDDSFLVDINLRLIPMMLPPPEFLTITGGEPTLLGEGLFAVIHQLKVCLPTTRVHILTNGRRFSRPSFAREFHGTHHPQVSLGIPLYADNAPDHDYVVQASGAFDQTLQGLYQLAIFNQLVEIRVVLHAHTVPRLPALCEFIYRNLPFVTHVALMGIEIVGFAKANLDGLWHDAEEIGRAVSEAAEMLAIRGMNVSIYNYPLCLLPTTGWRFARRSISDWKQTYAEPCQRCAERGNCGGLFRWAVEKYAGLVRPIS